MNADELKFRTKKFTIEVIKLVQSLSRNDTGIILGRQLLRSATSVVANY